VTAQVGVALPVRKNPPPPPPRHTPPPPWPPSQRAKQWPAGAVVGISVGVFLALTSACLCTFGLKQEWAAVHQRRVSAQVLPSPETPAV
jgi:hypothetical protein